MPVRKVLSLCVCVCVSWFVPPPLPGALSLFAASVIRELSMVQQLRHPAILAPNRVIQEFDGRGVITKLYLSFELMGPSLREILFTKVRVGAHSLCLGAPSR